MLPGQIRQNHRPEESKRRKGKWYGYVKPEQFTKIQAWFRWRAIWGSYAATTEI